MSEEVKLILEFIERRTTDLMKIINTKYGTVTDGGNDIAKKLGGKLSAYYAVKYFIEKGLRDDQDS